jgi:hypothetical protein
LVGVLLRAGMVLERHRGFGRTAVLVPHPVAAALALAETIAPSRPRNVRKAPAVGRLWLDNDSALRCASVRKPDGNRFVPVAYLVDLLSEREQRVVAWAAETGAGPVCEDAALSNDLLDLFRRRAERERFRAQELARAALLRSVLMADDVPAHVEEAA